jgi:hypothetical protein
MFNTLEISVHKSEPTTNVKILSKFVRLCFQSFQNSLSISSVCDYVHRTMYTAYCDVQGAAGLNVTQYCKGKDKAHPITGHEGPERD